MSGKTVKDFVSEFITGKPLKVNLGDEKETSENIIKMISKMAMYISMKDKSSGGYEKILASMFSPMLETFHIYPIFEEDEKINFIFQNIIMMLPRILRELKNHISADNIRLILDNSFYKIRFKQNQINRKREQYLDSGRKFRDVSIPFMQDNIRTLDDNKVFEQMLDEIKNMEMLSEIRKSRRVHGMRRNGDKTTIIPTSVLNDSSIGEFLASKRIRNQTSKNMKIGSKSKTLKNK